MRVLLVLNSYEQDGPGQLVRALCERLRDESGLSLSTAALSRGGPLRDAFESMRVPTSILDARPHRGWDRLRSWAESLAGSDRPPDVIHTNLLWPDLALRLLRDRLPRVPLVSTIHGLHAAGEKGVAGLVYDVAERITRSRHDHWVAVSHQVADDLGHAGYPRDAITVIPNGINALYHYPRPAHRRDEVRWMLDLAPDQELIVAAGNLRPVKDHATLLAAMPAIRSGHPGARLVIVGAGELREDLMMRARMAGIEEAVRIINPLATMLPDLLSTADVVVHPSRYESFGLVVAEAGACGTPVVATRAGGLPEIIEHGGTGFLVEVGDSAAIAERVSELLGDTNLRVEMGKNARMHIVDNFEISRTAEAYRELWLRLTGLELDTEISDDELPIQTEKGV